MEDSLDRSYQEGDHKSSPQSIDDGNDSTKWRHCHYISITHCGHCNDDTPHTSVEVVKYNLALGLEIYSTLNNDKILLKLPLKYPENIRKPEDGDCGHQNNDETRLLHIKSFDIE
jgi:hypothetical protein